MKYLLLVMFLLSLPGVLLSQDTLIFVIRVDDIMSRNTTVLPRSIKPFEDMVNEHNARVTWVVIPHRLVEPENQNGSLRQELLSSIQDGHEVCQHGYNHFCSIDNSWNHEMYCSARQVSFSAAYQESLIVCGKQILRDSLGIEPVSFVPPGHAADTTTYRLLQENGFNWISTTEPNKTYLYQNLFNLKPHAEFTWALQVSQYQTKLQQALSSIRSEGEADGYYCLLLHDYFIRSGYENGLVIRWTSELLDSLIVHYGGRIQFRTLQQAAQHFTSPPLALKGNSHIFPAGMILKQNYPNPFNPVTTIEFTLPQGGFVSLKVYNLLGQEVATLLSASLLSGRYEYEWDASGLASGVYLYKLEAGDYVDVRKMILLK
jgi:predicted deacetylase